MAFLRFVRDKRGYQSTFLLQNVRQDGKARSRVLYWFRSPPDIKVGRAVFDEEAIRLIEDANPDIEIDWSKVLEAKPPPPPPERWPRRRGEEGPAEVVRQGRRGGGGAPESGGSQARDAGQAASGVEESDRTAVPAAEPPVEPRVHPVEQRLGAQDLARLQARYAELLARIAEVVTEPERRDALRTEAEDLNPDSWVTAEEVAAGIEQFDARLAALRARLGRRRRSRRGGRRRRGATRGPESGGRPTEASGDDGATRSDAVDSGAESGSDDRDPAS